MPGLRELQDGRVGHRSHQLCDQGGVFGPNARWMATCVGTGLNASGLALEPQQTIDGGFADGESSSQLLVCSFAALVRLDDPFPKVHRESVDHGEL